MHETQFTELALPLADESSTAALATALAPTLTPGMVIWLRGDLGAGKTTFVRALLRARGETGPVKSPTYTLVEAHPVSGINFYHFDFYRFNQPEEYLDAGLDDYFSADTICLVEWPDKASPYVPPADLDIELLALDESARRATLRSANPRGASCLTAATSCALPPPA